MNLTVTINGSDRTGIITWPNFTITDVKDNQSNTCKFTIKSHAGQTYVPEIGDVVGVTDGSDTIFAGQIVRVTHSTDGLLGNHQIECVDFVFALKGAPVAASYQNQSVTAIIADLNSNYLTDLGYDASLAICATVIPSVQFDNISVADAIDKLATLVGWSWDVSYTKQILFYDLNNQPAPFALDDTSGKYVFGSLKITNDLSQLKNLVRVAGGVAVGTNRTEYLSGDGTRNQWPLANKFASKPTVTIGGVAKTVGVENIDNSANFDAMWDYNAQSIRFPNANPTAGTNNVAVTGPPEIPIIAEVQDAGSIAKYGIRGYYTKDTTISSKTEAKNRASAEVAAYRASISEGSFRTQTSGLKAGQTITISSAARGLSSESFLIQQVQLRMVGPNKGDWTATLATLRTIGIIKLLQDKLLNQQDSSANPDNVEIDKYKQLNEDVGVAEEITSTAHSQINEDVGVAEQIRKDPWAVEFVLGPYQVTGDADPKREAYADVGFIVY